MNKNKEIVRQSQIKIALEILKEKKIDYNLLELIVLTESLTDYITEGLVQNTTNRMRSVDNWMKNKTEQ